MALSYACTAAVKDGVARCKNLQPCSEHTGDFPTAPQPDGIWLNVPLGGRLIGVLEDVPYYLLTKVDEEQARFKRRERAEALGISVDKREREGDPEEDSGCAIFGYNKGLPRCKIRGLLEELCEQGFGILTFYCQEKERDERRRKHLKILLVSQPDHVSWQNYLDLNGMERHDRDFPVNVWLEEIEARAFGYTHVYANARDELGHLVHTVNQVSPYDHADYRLRYADGLWAAEELRR